jgi:probable rRNA maturation factor
MPVTVVVHVGEGLNLRRTAPGLGGRRGITRLVRRAVKAALGGTAVRDAELSIAIIADDQIAALHERYLGAPTPTDVLSFPLHEDGEAPLGDVYIGLLQAARQAERIGVPLDEELARLAIHGTLHILGYDHPEGAGREKSRMWKLQEQILWRLNTE